MVFAHSGLFNTSDGSINVNGIFKDATRQSNSFSETVLQFDEILISKLLTMNWQQLVPATISPGDTISHLNVTALFAKSDSSGAEIIIQEYHPVLTSDWDLDIHYNCDTLINSGNYINIGAMGNVKEVMEFIDRTGTAMLAATTPGKFITFLITDIAAKKHPAKIGGPVDIIRITKDDIQWIKVKEICR